MTLNFINTQLQQLMGTKEDFGGSSVIAVGDLYQLKPVNDKLICLDLEKGTISLGRNLWKEVFTMYELVDIMRQKDNLAFAQLLNRLRLNEMTEEDKQTNKSCRTVLLALILMTIQRMLFICLQRIFIYKTQRQYFEPIAWRKSCHDIPCHPNAKLVILGDFNVQIDSGKSEFVNFMETLFRTTQQIKKCTTDSGSILDLILTNC